MDWIQSFLSPPGSLLVASPPPPPSRSSTSSSRPLGMWSKPRSSKTGRGSLKATASSHSRQRRRPGDCRWEISVKWASQQHHVCQVQADNIMLKERKLNIAPAIKKQVFLVVTGEVIYHARLHTPITHRWRVVAGRVVDTNLAKSLIENGNQLINYCNVPAVLCCFISFLFISKPTAGALCPTMWGSQYWTVAITTVPQVRLALLAGVLCRASVERRVLQARPTHITTVSPCSPPTRGSSVAPAWASSWASSSSPARRPVRPPASPSPSCTAPARPPPPCSSPQPASPSTSSSSSQPLTSTTWRLPFSLRSVSPAQWNFSSFPQNLHLQFIYFSLRASDNLLTQRVPIENIQKNFIAFFSAIEPPEKWSVLLKTPNFNFSSFHQLASQVSLLQSKTFQPSGKKGPYRA